MTGAVEFEPSFRVASLNTRKVFRMDPLHPRARAVVRNVGFGIEIGGIEAPDMGQQRLRELAPLDLVDAEGMLQ